jgi:hypothetical protein
MQHFLLILCYQQGKIPQNRTRYSTVNMSVEKVLCQKNVR